MKILFLHGWHSVPGGVKPTYLQDHGQEVINPALDDVTVHGAVTSRGADWLLRLASTAAVSHWKTDRF